MTISKITSVTEYPRHNLWWRISHIILGKKNAMQVVQKWYIDGDNKKGESKKAGKQFFNTDIIST